MKNHIRLQGIAFITAIVILFISLLIENTTFVWLFVAVIVLAVISFFVTPYIELVIRAKRINRYQPQPSKKV